MIGKSTSGTILVLLMILPALLVTPLLIGESYTTTTPTSFPKGDVQVAGARLPEYTEHVPIIITSTQDFISQGWPGSGTELDPFLIYGLNITYDVGLVSINITNTDAHFKIVDCVINQQTASVDAVHFENVSYGRIEYSTISAVDGHVSLNNASNTVLDHVDMAMDAGTAVYVVFSHQVSVTHSTITASLGGAFYVVNSNQLTIEDISFEGVTSNDAIYEKNSNGTRIRNFRADTALSFGDFNQMEDLLVEDSSGTGLTYGILLYSVNDVIIDGTSLTTASESVSVTSLGGTSNLTVDSCQLTSSNEYGIRIIDTMNDTTIVNSRISSSLHGVGVIDSHGILIQNNIFENIAKGYVIDVSSSSGLVVSGNTISYVDVSSSIVLEDVLNTTISDNSFENTADYAIEAFRSNDTVVTHNTLTDIDSGIYSEQTFFWQVVSNSFSFSARAFNVYNCSNYNVSYNTLTGGASSAMLFREVDGGLVVVGNEITDNAGEGIYVEDSPWALIENNTLSQVNIGVSLTTSGNATVRLNVINDAESDGIRIWWSEDARIHNNAIGSGPLRGIYAIFPINEEFLGNTMTDCGFYLGEGETLPWYVFSMDSSNEVNGLPVYYGLNQHGVTLDGRDYGQIIIVNSTDVTIQNGTFDRPTVAVTAYYSQFMSIDNIRVDSAYKAMYLLECTNVTVTDSYFNGLPGEVGIKTDSTNNVTLAHLSFSHWSEER